MKTVEIQVTFIMTVPDDTKTNDLYFGDVLEKDIETKDGFVIEDYATDHVTLCD